MRDPHLVVGDVDGLHHLQAARWVLGRPVPGPRRLHEDRGKGPSVAPAAALTPKLLHNIHQRLHVAEDETVARAKRNETEVNSERGGGTASVITSPILFSDASKLTNR